VTPLAGIRAAPPDAEVEELAAQIDVVICVAGYAFAEEGEYVIPALQDIPAFRAVLPSPKTDEDRKTVAILEGKFNSSGDITAGAGGDRISLRLREEDEKLIATVAAKNSKTVVSIVTAGAVIVEAWNDKVPAILMS
jgi:hypothetical protein